MPASLAHMVIAHKAMDRLTKRGPAELATFAAVIDDPTKGKLCRAYMNLGSIGPDLYYYASMAKAGWDMFTDGFVQATGVTPWAYHLHSCRPNAFPLNLCEVLFSDAVRTNGEVDLRDDDMYKLAYIAGHLTHIAADQIIHPLVNSIAEPYYRDGKNRKKHQACEVFQDYFLFEEVYRGKRDEARGRGKAKYDFFKQPFARWVDCIPRRTTTRNTHDWFRYFLQRGFVEAYGMFPDEDTIEDSVDNLLKVLKYCTIRGPYKKAAEEYKDRGAESPMYQEYIEKPDYVRYYEEAVRLSAVYITALYEVYVTLKGGGDFTQTKGRFLKIVSDADLSCPLQKGILKTAQAALVNPKAGGAKYKPIFARI